MTILDKFIKTSYPYRYASLKSKSIFLPGFQGLPLYDVVVFFKNQVQKVGLNDRARSIAFSFLMAIPAATIFLVYPYTLSAGFKKTHLSAFTTDQRNNTESKHIRAWFQIF